MDEVMVVQCSLCDDMKIYKTKNERRCPYRTTHNWMFVGRMGRDEAKKFILDGGNLPREKGGE